MRFPFRRRRTQVRSAPTAAVVQGEAPPVRSTDKPFNPIPQEEPVSELTPRERKLYRVTTKREQRTAGQLAVRAGLQSADGSGRGVVRDLNALVAAGKLTRHGVKTPYSYTRAA